MPAWLSGFSRCPWDQYAPTTLDFCERKLCDWVATPLNAYSCAAFVLVGAWIIARATRRRLPALTLVGWSSIAVGLLSFAYHATCTFFGEFLDLSSMFFLSATMVVLNMRVGRGFTVRRLAAIWSVVVAVSLALVLLWEPAGIPIFALHLGWAVTSHVHTLRAYRAPVDYRWLKALFGLFALSFGVWLLDVTRVWCDPDNHFINGHTVWHLCNATCVALYYRYIEQFGPAIHAPLAAVHREAAATDTNEAARA